MITIYDCKTMANTVLLVPDRVVTRALIRVGWGEGGTFIYDYNSCFARQIFFQIEFKFEKKVVSQNMSILYELPPPINLPVTMAMGLMNISSAGFPNVPEDYGLYYEVTGEIPRKARW